MNKFLAVIRREYVQRVRTKMFVIITVLGPVLMAVFTVVPMFIFNIKTGGPTRIAVVDQTGKMFDRVRDSIMRGNEESADATAKNNTVENTFNANSKDKMQRAGKSIEGRYLVEEVSSAGRSLVDVRQELNARVRREQLDAYIVLPENILESGAAEFYGRNASDVFTREHLAESLSRAVRDQRMADAKIDQNLLREINQPVRLDSNNISERGAEKDSGSGFWLVFGVGFLIYITILMYGQTILAAVIEEKETRIAEVLFSSMRAFPLMMGKLIGVSLVALTQYAIWGVAFGIFALYGASALIAQGVPISLPAIPFLLVVYFFLFFILGYFIYATIYALVGSMVTTTQEGGQLAMPVIFMLVIGFYLAFPVIRSPNSSFAFWVSMIPFFAPITMLVRIVAQTPPFWQIALSLLIGFSTVVLLLWLAARIYRIGMLMYGKRASIPEVVRWVRQA